MSAATATGDSTLADVGDVRQNHRFDEARLSAYLEKSIAGFRGPIAVTQFSRGQSNPTFLVTGASGRYVLRKKPPGDLLPTAHQIEREYRLLRALQGTSVPVPAAHLLCEDTDIIGTAFYVMDFLDGRIFRNPTLPGLTREERRGVFAAMAEAMAQLHAFDWQAAGLASFGKPQEYIKRQISRWTRQYEATKSEKNEALDRLVEWLPAHIPAAEVTTIAHGDFHLQNLVFHPTQSKVIGILDWELATLGHPLSDLAYNCMIYHLPGSTLNLGGLMDSDLGSLGIPGEREYVDIYCRQAGIGHVDDWNFYLAFAFFRCAAIAQGIHARAVQGIASAANALEVGRLAWPLAEAGWRQVTAR